MGIKPRALPNDLQELEMRKFDKNSRNQAIVRTLSASPNHNAFSIEKTTVTTSATEITFPSGDDFTVFHQTSGGIVYFSSEDTVSNSDPKMKEDDILSIEGRADFTLYMVADSGSVDVFVMSTVKE